MKGNNGLDLGGSHRDGVSRNQKSESQVLDVNNWEDYVSIPEVWETGRTGVGWRLGKSSAYVNVFRIRLEVSQGQRLVLLTSVY